VTEQPGSTTGALPDFGTTPVDFGGPEDGLFPAPVVQEPAADPAAGVGPAAAAEPAAAAATAAELASLHALTSELAASQAETRATLGAQLAELLRLRTRDADLADRLYAENTRLRAGEFNAAVAPLYAGLVRLHDQMTSLAGGDNASVAGMLRTQLLQLLDTAAGLAPFAPAPGERFDSGRHAGVGRAKTVDPDAEGTVARTLKPGFVRADGSILRVAEVEVYRFDSR
jgi:hypothetical protein